ncbi:MAG TPA: ComEC/Rec2 family competence protein [candidate division Zixibacteria bacterium]|nr:ComEC/Rec2 family competence protein [candidate division Zixibacteria bacterium]
MLRKYPAVFILPFIVLGIVSADLFRPESEWLLVACLASCLAGLVLRNRQPQTAMLLLTLSLALFVSFRFAATVYDTGPDSLNDRFQSGQRYTVHARVVDWPVIKNNRTEIRLTVDSLGEAGSTTACRGGLLLKVTDLTTALQRGDKVKFSTRLYRPRGGESLTGFDYGRFLQLRGIEAVAYQDNLLSLQIDRTPRSSLYYAVHVVRQAILEIFQKHLSPDAAALASGFLIGETRDVPLDIYRMFRDSGTLHLLAVSGSNVALIVLFVIVLLRPLHLPRQVRSVILWGTILFFCWLSYAEPSVIRAGLMASLIILAQVLERRYDLNNVIAVTALIILLVDPSQFYSVGFQLSFATAWGLILVFSDMHLPPRGIMRHRWVRWWLLLFLATITAQFFSAPLTAYYFERIPLISPLANLLIVPAVSLAVLGSVLLLLMEALLPWVAGWVGWILDLLLRLVIIMLQWFGGDHVPLWRLAQPSLFTVLGSYVILALGALGLKHSRLRRSAVVIAVVLVNVWLAIGIVDNLHRDHNQTLDILTIPGGVAVIVRQAESKVADLYISSAHSRSYSLAEAVLDPQLQAAGIRHLRHLIVADADFGALGNLLTTAETFHADTVWLPEFLRASSMDIGHREKPNNQPVHVAFFNPTDSDFAGPAMATEGGFCLKFAQIDLLLSMSPSAACPVPLSSDYLCLICGRLTKTVWEDLNDNVDLLVCSSSEQAVQPSSDRTKLLDLSRIGTLRLELSGDSLHTPLIGVGSSDYD